MAGHLGSCDVDPRVHLARKSRCGPHPRSPEGFLSSNLKSGELTIALAVGLHMSVLCRSAQHAIVSSSLLVWKKSHLHAHWSGWVMDRTINPVLLDICPIRAMISRSFFFGNVPRYHILSTQNGGKIVFSIGGLCAWPFCFKICD